MEFLIQFAKNKKWSKLILYSNTKLKNSIHLYKKYGFKEIPLERNLIYSGKHKDGVNFIQLKSLLQFLNFQKVSLPLECVSLIHNENLDPLIIVLNF